ncbi:MAG: hypothetical protein ABFD50_00095 [Smithella sp.]
MKINGRVKNHMLSETVHAGCALSSSLCLRKINEADGTCPQAKTLHNLTPTFFGAAGKIYPWKE